MIPIKDNYMSISHIAVSGYGTFMALFSGNIRRD